MKPDTLYNTFKTKEGNIIWAGAMNLCWSEFKQSIAKEDVKLKDCKDSDLVYILNHPKFSNKDIHQNYYYTKSGFGPQTIKIINKEMKQKFPQKTTQDINYQMKPEDIISYAYLAKALQFEQEFQINQSGLRFNSVQINQKGQKKVMKKQVQSFFGKQNFELDQVKEVFHESNNEFCIAIKGKCNKNGVYDIMFVIRTDKQYYTIDKAIQTVMKVQNTDNLKHLVYQRFQMPIIEFDQTHEYTQLQGKTFQNKSIEGKKLAAMKQNIKLRIDHKGAKLQNSAQIFINQCAISYIDNFIVNGPFWIIMRQDCKHPYLCVKINSLRQNLSELVIQFKDYNQNQNQQYQYEQK